MDEKRPPHYLREWRKHRGFTQESLAAAVGTSKSQISELERFNLQLSPKWLMRIAPVLDVQQGHIIDHNPDDLDSDIIDIWTRIPQRDRANAAKALRGFIRTGTAD
jgi:transcriptional regulator with XRE-family HTH domain